MFTKIFLIAVGCIIMLLGCSYQVVEPEFNYDVPADNTYKGIVRTGEVRELRVPEAVSGAKQQEYVWTTHNGKFLNHQGNVVLFQAPDTSGIITVSCRVLERKKVLASYHFELTAFKQVVVLKADDLVYSGQSIFPQPWNLYFDLVDSLGIKGSAGIVGNSLENAPQAYYNRIKMYHQRGNIEFWNHGYDHSLNIRKANGEIAHEFFNRDYQDQYKHLSRTQELGCTKLGITFLAFGAPGNKIDQETARMIEVNNDIRIWFYGPADAEKSILSRSAACEIEYPTHKPDFAKFLAKYDPAEEFLTLQFHPTGWDQYYFAEFRKVLLYLHQQGTLFMTPSEFAWAFYPHLMEKEALL